MEKVTFALKVWLYLPEYMADRVISNGFSYERSTPAAPRWRRPPAKIWREKRKDEKEQSTSNNPFSPSFSLRQSVVCFVRIARRESGVSEFTFHILRGCVYVYKPQEKTLSRGKEEDEKCVFIGVPHTFVLLFGP